MLIEYIKLQFKLNFRKLKDSGFNPWALIILMIAGFAGLTVHLFSQTTYAETIYVAIALSLISKLSDEKRNEFFKINFGDSKAKRIRVAENLVLAFPFLLVLLFKSLFFSAVFLGAFCLLLAFFQFKTQFSFTIPTPFSKKPFEFAVGFRNSFPLLIAAYGLIPVAVQLSNFNFGIFALAITFLISMGYYNKPEDVYYVWSSNRTPAQFLFEKIKIALGHSSILIAPLIAALAYLFPENTLVLFLSILIGWAFLAAIVLAKYTSFPDEINVSQGMLIAICITFPPLLLAVIPYLFQTSKTRLSTILK
jgi:hypothetical protein